MNSKIRRMVYEEELIFKINRKTFAVLLFIAILFFGVISLYLQWDNKKRITDHRFHPCLSHSYCRFLHSHYFIV